VNDDAMKKVSGLSFLSIAATLYQEGSMVVHNIITVTNSITTQKLNLPIS